MAHLVFLSALHFLERVMSASREFFALPEHEKSTLSMAKSGRHWKGWFRLGGELTSGAPDHKEGLYLGDDLPLDHPEVVQGTLMHGPCQWPTLRNHPGFREDILKYLDELERVSHVVLSAIAESLSLQHDHFDATFRPTPTRLLRIFQYPAPTDDTARARWGVGEHCDYGVLTVLLQDNVGGLEVKDRAGNWIPAPPLPGTFVVNIGDMLERLTWGRYRATPHRVRNSSMRVDRISIPFFFDPCWHAVVEPIPELRTGAPPSAVQRWDGQDVVANQPREYGDIITSRIALVFPELFVDTVSKL